MAETKLINTFTILAFLLLLETATAISPNLVGDDCHKSTPQNLSTAYQTNLNAVLSWLSTNAGTSKGYHYTAIGDNNNNTQGDAVYGLYDCRGDVTGYFCQFCVSTATREILQRCPNRVSAVTWYSFCILRYSNKDFFGKVILDPSWNITGSEKVSDPTEVEKGEDYMRGLIRKATKWTNLLYSMGEFSLSPGKKRYGLVQCSRDLTNEGCSQYLEAMLEKVPECCGDRVGWMVWTPSCLLKYDDFMFYDLNNQLSSSPNPTTSINFFLI